MEKINKFIDKHMSIIIIIIMTIIVPISIYFINPIIAKYKIESEMKYGNCHIVSELTGGLYICKK